jgi:glycosyltransferase involved in cell wall biosynthesis
MKIAFVHDRLYYIAWAEQVFFEMIQDRIKNTNKSDWLAIFTMFSDKHFLIIEDRTIPIITALPKWKFWLFTFFDKHKIPVLSKIFDYRNLMFFYPVLIRILRWKIKQFHADEVQISSFAVAKNVIPVYPNSKVFLRLQSPFMYIHNHFSSNLKKLKFPIKQIYQFAASYLKPRDLQPREYANISTNSKYTSSLVKNIYGIAESTIEYPKLDQHFFTPAIQSQRSDYFVFVGRLVTFSKQVDTIIKAFNKLNIHLKIIGSGPDEQYLKSIADSNIEFLGRMSDAARKAEIIWKAQGLVNITLESFGYVTAESLCVGTPVLGYNEGATVELIDSDLDGILIASQTEEELITAIKAFQDRKWNYNQIGESARAKFEASTLKFELN